MKFSRSVRYFSQLRSLIGWRAACALALTHLWNKLNPPRKGRLASIPVGPYVFYFPSLNYFVGLFTEIFFEESYYLAPTQEPIRAIDCGANIGMSLLYIKLRAPHARVLCFEPNPDARAVLEKNIGANNWEKEVQVLPYALGKEKGTAEFFVESKEATSSGGSIAHYQKNKARGLNSYTVDVDTLSHHIDGAIYLLKMDIEGSEFDVLEELAARHKLQNIASLQLEYHFIPGFFTRTLGEMLILLEMNEFHTYVASIAPPHQIIGHTTSHTYMIFAWR